MLWTRGRIVRSLRDDGAMWWVGGQNGLYIEEKEKKKKGIREDSWRFNDISKVTANW